MEYEFTCLWVIALVAFACRDLTVYETSIPLTRAQYVHVDILFEIYAWAMTGTFVDNPHLQMRICTVGSPEAPEHRYFRWSTHHHPLGEEETRSYLILNNNVHTATCARTDADRLSTLTNGLHHVVMLRYAGIQKRTVQLMQTHVGRETSLNPFNMRRGMPQQGAAPRANRLM